MILLTIFLVGVAMLFVGGLTLVALDRARRRDMRAAQRRREQPATLEGGGSHLSADRTR